jgi:surfactin synthase thioesterase subunit
MSLFVRPRRLADPSLRLIAFHHAGGSAAMYHAMSAALPATWELLILDLPGRGKRHAEPLISAMPAAVARVVEDVRPWLDVPVALFGHSLGAILAAEVGRACQGLGLPPVWVGVSGRVAPALQAQTRRLNLLDDDTLLAHVVGLGGTPGRIGELGELRERFLRVVRADLALLESYRPEPGRAALCCPVTAFAGASDEWAPPSTMRPWARETQGEFRQHEFAGGHFYFLGPALADLTATIVGDLGGYLAAGAAAAELL